MNEDAMNPSAQNMNTQLIQSPFAPIVDRVGVPIMWFAIGALVGVGVGYYLRGKR